MNARLFCGSILALCGLASLGCNHLSGKPSAGAEAVRPDKVTDFSQLYTQNCSACHGADGQHGAAIALANPVYQAIVDEGTLRDVITNGEPATGAVAADPALVNVTSVIVSPFTRPFSVNSVPANVAV